MSSLWGKYDVIKQFLVSFQVKIWASLIFSLIWLKFDTGVNFEALISNLNLKKLIWKIHFEREKAIFYENGNFAKVLLDKSIAMATP